MSGVLSGVANEEGGGSRRWDIAALIQWSTKYFTHKEISNGRLEAEWLLAHALQLQRVDLYVQHDRPLSPTELTTFRELVSRRAGGEPFQYIIGVAPFYGRDFRVTPEVLIPRPETETLIRVLQRPSEEANPPGTILDIGTGAGCLAITAALLHPRAQVLALDVSNAALAVAEENAHTMEAGNVSFQPLDILTDLPSGRYDAVLTNPPYVAADELPTLQREIREHEPEDALTDGADGLTFFRRLAEVGHSLLEQGGRLIMELGGAPQAGPVREIFEGREFAVSMHQDMQGEARVCEAR